jgi:hypothetical protein
LLEILKTGDMVMPNEFNKPVLPKGWIAAGSHPKQYDMGTDSDEHHSGTKCGYMKCKVDEPQGFGTLMQMIEADAMRDKRYRLTGWTKAKDVDNWAGMWMRVDGPEKGKSLSFDNMQERPITGTQEWSINEIVLDVPADATFVAFGVLLNGSGQVWMDDFNFEEVDETVPLTGASKNGAGGYRKTFINMNFEE